MCLYLSLVGFDVPLIEAMAFNIPACSSQLKYLDFDYKELGIFIDSESKIVNKIKWMINNYKVLQNAGKQLKST